MAEDRSGCEQLSAPVFVPANWGEASAIYDSPKNYPAEAPYTKVLYVPNNFVIKVEYLKTIKEETH